MLLHGVTTLQVELDLKFAFIKLNLNIFHFYKMCEKPATNFYLFVSTIQSRLIKICIKNNNEVKTRDAMEGNTKSIKYKQNKA